MRTRNQLKSQSIGINDLPDDCLLLIFNELSLYEAVTIEKVCKRWEAVSLKLWATMKSAVLWSKKKEVEKGKMIPSFHVEQFLQRSGNYIRDLKFVGRVDANQTLSAISKYCKKLQYLEFSYSFGKQEINLKKISVSVAKNLKGLYFYNNCKINKASLKIFLKRAVNLENLWLEACMNITNDALLNLSSTCTDLNLEFCKLNKHKHSMQLFQKLPKLNCLDVSRTNIIPEAIVSVSENLTQLALRGTATKFFEGNKYKNLFMPNLEDLDLSYNLSVTDEVISYFSTCFPALKDLSLQGCEKVKCDASCRLKECRNLRDLNLTETDTTDFDFINLVIQMNDLESLSADCDDISETGLLVAVYHLPKMEWLFVGEPFRLSKNFFKEALRYVKLRKEHVKLEIEIDCLEKNAKKRKQIVKDEIARLKLETEKNEDSISCVVTLGDSEWYVDASEN